MATLRKWLIEIPRWNMDNNKVQRQVSPVVSTRRRLNFSEPDKSSASSIDNNLHDSPKTPPNHVTYIPITPAVRRDRSAIPFRFAEYLAPSIRADSPLNDAFFSSTPKRNRVLELDAGLSDRSQLAEKCSNLYENKNSCQLHARSLPLPKAKQYSINPFSPAADNLRSKWVNNDNDDNKSSKSGNWSELLTNVELSDLVMTRYFKEFKVECLIGKGDFGDIYKCINMLEGMPYAIKKTLKKVVGTRRENYARKEVYANAALFSHPNIVAYHSAWNEDNFIFIQLEYCDGGNLDEMIFTKHYDFNDAAIKRLLSHLSSGIHYMHMSKLVHLDIKPANIMISRYQSGQEDDDKGDREIVYKIGDLGHAVHVDNLRDVEDGDGRYLPKEMLSGEYDGSTINKVDIFSLGMTAYEAVLALRLPSDGPEWHFLRDGFMPDFKGFGLNLLLANMIDPNPLNRPNAIDVYKNVKLKAEEQADLSNSQIYYSF